MAGENEGFFTFGNNAEENAAQIIAAYEKIQRALEQPLLLNDRVIAADIAQVEEGLGKLQSVAEERMAAIQRAFNDLRTGKIEFPDLRAAVQTQIEGAAREVPTLIAKEFGKLDPATFARQNLSGIAGEATETITKYLNDAVASLGQPRGANGRFTGRVPQFDAAQLIEQNKIDPLNVAALSDVEAAQRRVLAERLAKAQYNNTLYQSQSPGDVAQRLGMTDDVHAVLNAQPVPVPGERRPAFVETGAAEELKAAQARLVAELKERADAEKAAADQVKADAKEEEAAAAEAIRSRNLSFLSNSPYAQQTKSGSILGDTVYDRKGNNLSAIAGDETASLDARLTAERQIDAVYAERNALLDQEFERIVRNGDAAAASARKQSEQQGGVLNGAVGRLDKRGGLANNIGEQLVQAFDYTIGYALLFGALAELKDTISEFAQYQSAVVDLNIAMGQGSQVTQSYVSDLSELSRVAGSNVAEAVTAATQGVYALTNAQDSDAVKKRAGLNTATAASQLAVVANKPLQDATGDILATATGFGVGPDNLNSIVDAVASAKRHVGGDAAQISQGLANLAVVAQQAGFTLGQTADIIALVQSRTDESGSTVASRLTRILQTLNGSTGQGLARDLRDQLSQYTDSTGQPTSGQSSAPDQLSAYANIYSNPATDKASKEEIASKLGGIASLRELLPLLTQAGTLQAAYTASLKSGGEGLDEYQQKSETFAGTLKKIQGDISNIQVGLSQSGIGDIFGGAIKALEPALYALDQFLNLWNELPRPMRTVAGLLVDILLASKGIAAIQSVRAARAGAEGTLAVAGGKTAAVAAAGAVETEAATVAAANAASLERQLAFTRAMTIANDEAATADQRAAAAAEAKAIAANAEAVATERAAAAAGEKAVAEDVEAASTGKAGLAGGGRALLGALTSTGAIATIGAIAVAAAAGIKFKNDHIADTIRDQYNDSSAAYGKVDGTSLSLASAAGQLQGTADRIDETKFKSYIFGLFGGPSQSQKLSDKAESDTLSDRAKGLTYLSQQVAQEERLAAAQHNVSIFGDGAITTVNQLAQGLNQISQNGGSALTQYNALVEALLTPPPKGKALFEPERLATQITSALMGAASDKSAIPKGVSAGMTQVNPGDGDHGFKKFLDQTFGDQIQYDPVDPRTAIPLGKDQQKALSEFIINDLNKRHVSPSTGITPKQVAQITQDAGDQLDLSGIMFGSKEYRQSLVASALKSLNGKAMIDPASPLGALNGKSLTSTQIGNILNPGQAPADGSAAYPGLIAAFQSAQQAVPESDDGSGALAVLKTQRKTLDAILKKGLRGGADPETLSQLGLLLDNAKHEYAQQALTQMEQLRKAAESRTYDPATQAAVRLSHAKGEFKRIGNDVPLLEGLMQSLDRQTINSVIAYEKQARDTMELALKHAQALLAETIASFGAGDIGKGGQAITDAQGNVDKVKKRLDQQNANIAAAIKALNHSDISADNVSGSHDSPEQIAAAQAAAAAAKAGGGGIEEARAAIASAQASLHEAVPGTVAYFNALASLYQAQQQMRNAVVQYKNTVDQLHGDITDPVEQARDALRAAARQLAADHGAGADVRATDELAVKQARAQVESAAFSQRLSDIQTAEQLGNISYQTYIRYLEHESQRLHGINHKTRQQIDEMNQIDLALKDAMDQADGFFNIGDIRTAGLVYQVRAFAGAFEGGGGGGGRGGGPGSIGYQPSVVNTNSHNSVTIHGADTATVKRLLKELLGPTTQTRATSSRRV